MVPRRTFLTALGSALAISPLALSATSPRGGRKKLAMVTTEWRYGSHAWHMGERFLVGYPIQSKWHMPDLQVVSVYVDQTPADDLSRKRAAEFGFTVTGPESSGETSLAVFPSPVPRKLPGWTSSRRITSPMVRPAARQ